jgi:hypothetical protein
VVHVEETVQAHGVTFATAEVGGGPTAVVEVALMTCELMECRLGSTSMEHPSTIFRRS